MKPADVRVLRANGLWTMTFARPGAFDELRGRPAMNADKAVDDPAPIVHVEPA